VNNAQKIFFRKFSEFFNDDIRWQIGCGLGAVFQTETMICVMLIVDAYRSLLDARRGSYALRSAAMDGQKNLGR
jgi:hypothetical protein